MALRLDGLAPKSNKKPAKRVGRGSGSGKGNFSARGVKGQRARTGGTNKLAYRGLRAQLLATPKSRGFKSIYVKNVTVTLATLERYFAAGDTINLKSLTAKRVTQKTDKAVTIVATGALTKALAIEGCRVTAGAKERIIAAGGTIA